MEFAVKRFLSFALCFALVFSLMGCSKAPNPPIKEPEAKASSAETTPTVVPGGFEYRGALHDGILDKKEEAEALNAAGEKLREFYSKYYTKDGNAEYYTLIMTDTRLPKTIDELVENTQCILIPSYELTRRPSKETTDLFAISRQVPSHYTLVFMYQGEAIGSCDWFKKGDTWTTSMEEPEAANIALQEENIRIFSKDQDRIVRFIYKDADRWAVFFYDGKEYANYELIQGSPDGPEDPDVAYTIPELAQFDF
jgi:hypothetical protein